MGSLLVLLILVLLVGLAGYLFRLSRHHRLPRTRWSDLGLWSRFAWVVALTLLAVGIGLSAAAIGLGWTLLTIEDPAYGDQIQDIVAGPVYLTVTLLLVLSFLLALRRPTAAGLLLGITAILAPVFGNVIVLFTQPSFGAEGGNPIGPLIVTITYFSAPTFIVAVLLLTVALPRELRLVAEAKREQQRSVPGPGLERVPPPSAPNRGAGPPPGPPARPE